MKNLINPLIVMVFFCLGFSQVATAQAIQDDVIPPRMMMDLGVLDSDVYDDQELLSKKDLRLRTKAPAGPETVRIVSLYDARGKLVYEEVQYGTPRAINTARLAAGQYTVQVKSKQGVYRQTFIKY